MIKMLLFLLSVMVIGVATLQMRQQELELKHRAAALQGRIEAQQAKLWSQQLQIATATSPHAIRQTVGSELDLVPEHEVPIHTATWIGE
jgi:cell division protein FtsL